MKSVLMLLTAASLSTNAFAARDIISLDCKSRANSFANVTLTVKSYWGNEATKEGVMRNVSMTVVEEGQTAEGRNETIDNDTNYKPKKYKDHLRFDMSKLVNTKSFGRFSPIDSCNISVMVPNSLISSNASRVELPVNFTCDQSGGAQTLDCEVKTVR